MWLLGGRRCGYDRRRSISRAVINHQFRKDRQGRHALGQHQLALAYLLAPIVSLPAGRAVTPDAHPAETRVHG